MAFALLSSGRILHKYLTETEGCILFVFYIHFYLFFRFTFNGKSSSCSGTKETITGKQKNLGQYCMQSPLKETCTVIADLLLQMIVVCLVSVLSLTDQEKIYTKVRTPKRAYLLKVHDTEGTKGPELACQPGS